MHECAWHADFEDAETWALSRIVHEFGLKQYDTYDEVVADTDGVLLAQEQVSDVKEALLSWAIAQVTVLSSVRQFTQGVLADDARAYGSPL